MEGATSRPRTDKGPSGRACARYRRILLSLRLWEGDCESKQRAQGPLPCYVSPSLPVKAGHQEVVTTTNPNQARSASPLGTWALLHEVKVTPLALRELGVQLCAHGGGFLPTPPALQPVCSAGIVPVEVESCAVARRAVSARLCSLLPASSHPGSKPC